MEKLTESEKAAIYYYIYGGCKDRVTLYKIAKGEENTKHLKYESIKTIGSNWFRSHNVQKAIEYLQTIQEAEQKKIAENAVKNIETVSQQNTGTGLDPDHINFLNLDEFLKEANKLANLTKDEKERRAWLEMIGKYMSFKDRSEGENTEIKRFYTPVECEKCVIYNKCKDCKYSDCPEML